MRQRSQGAMPQVNTRQRNADGLRVQQTQPKEYTVPVAIEHEGSTVPLRAQLPVPAARQQQRSRLPATPGLPALQNPHGPGSTPPHRSLSSSPDSLAQPSLGEKSTPPATQSGFSA